MKKIDVDSWDRREHYKVFSNTSAPCYGADVRMDVTKLVQHCKSQNRSFFINMLFIVTETLNGIDEFRMRNYGGEPYIFGSVNPSFTIMTDHGYYVNRRVIRAPYAEFYGNAEAVVRRAKTDTRMSLNSGGVKPVDDLYFSCTPWMDFASITQPIPYNDKDNATIPRIVWGKYVNENGAYRVTMNITVNHAFIDGYPLSLAFINVQKMLDEFDFNFPDKF